MTTPAGGPPLKLLVLLPDLADDAAARQAVDLLEAGTRTRRLDVEAVAWKGGPLLDDLRGLGAVSVVTAGGATAFVTRGLNKVGSAPWGVSERRRRLGLGPFGRHGPDAVYLSSPRAAPMLRSLPASGGPPVVVMVAPGEMTNAEPEPLSDEGRALLLGRADRFLVQTEGGSARLSDLGVPNTSIVHLGEPTSDLSATRPSEERLVALRDRLGLAPGVPVVTGMGPVAWKGGADLFVRAVWVVRARLGRALSGVWVATSSDPLERAQLLHDIAHMGLEGRVHVLGPEDEDALWLGDLHLITSRQTDDAPTYFPAARRTQAVVGFRTDHLAAFLADRGDVLVDFLDLDHLARTSVDLLDDDRARTALAAHVRRRFLEWHESPDHVDTVIAVARGDR